MLSSPKAALVSLEHDQRYHVSDEPSQQMECSRKTSFLQVGQKGLYLAFSTILIVNERYEQYINSDNNKFRRIESKFYIYFFRDEFLRISSIIISVLNLFY